MDDISVILVCESTAVHVGDRVSTQTLGQLDGWIAAIQEAGVACEPSDISLCTSALYYKAFEFWAFARGIGARQIINNGRSVSGDTRYVA